MEGEIGDGDATEPCSDGEGIDDDDKPEGIESFFPLRDRPSIGGRERDEGNQGTGCEGETGHERTGTWESVVWRSQGKLGQEDG